MSHSTDHEKSAIENDMIGFHSGSQDYMEEKIEEAFRHLCLVLDRYEVCNKLLVAAPSLPWIRSNHDKFYLVVHTNCTDACLRSVMGNKLVTFTEQQLENYQDCTFFTRKEILRVQKRFREVEPEVVPKCMTGNQTVTVRVSPTAMEKLPEFKENPFKKRICEVFSRDGKGNLSFEDFLDLLSVFSEQAPRDIKVFYAFCIYDFDGDQHIGSEDLHQTLTLLTRQELTAEEMQQIVEKVIEEADVDGDGKLSFMEFEHVITRAPDFLSTFHIRI